MEYWKYCGPPIFFCIIGIGLLIFEVIKNKRIKLALSTNEGITNSFGMGLIMVALVSLWKQSDLYREFMKTEQRLVTTKVVVASPPDLNPAKTKKITISSNLSPSINILIAKRLNTINLDTVSCRLHLIFSYPTAGFIHSYAGGARQEYWPTSNVSVKVDSCGVFPIEKIKISRIDNTTPQDLQKQLSVQLMKAVLKHIDEICLKIQPCLLEKE